MNDGLRPYPDYKDSALHWLGQIPKHWTEKRAKYFFREVDERSTTGEEQLMSVSHKTGVTPRKSNVTMFKAESNVGHKICRPGDLAINTLWAWMAALGVSRQTGLVSPAYGVYRQRDASNYHPEFIDFLLRTQPYAAEYRCRSTGITASRLRLYPIDFLRIPLVQPPRDEQELIVNYLRHQDTLVRNFIRNRRRLIEVLNEQKQAIINQAVTRGLDRSTALVSSKVDWLGKIPATWQRKRLKFLAKIIYGSSPHNSTYNADGIGTLLVNGPDEYSVEDFGHTRAIKWTTAPVKFAPAGALLFCLRGSTTGRLNLCHADVSIGRGVAALVPNGNNRYFTYAMMALRSHLKATFRGSTFPSVKSEQLNNYWLPDPLIPEQEQIADRIDSDTKVLNEALTVAYREIDLIREYRNRLITDVVTGKLDVRHIALLPGSLDPDDQSVIDVEESLDDNLDGEDETDLVEEAIDADN